MEENNNTDNNNKKSIIITIIIIAVITAGALYVFKPSLLNIITKPIGIDAERPVVIEENLVIPDTKKVTVGEARTITAREDAVEVPLQPKSNGEKIIIKNAVLTLKGGYELALVEAKKWSSDADLVWIKSLGAVTLEGKSSTWQIVFGSKNKKKGYEVIIQEDKALSQKEVESSSYGYEVPERWNDSSDAIISLQTLPQFSDATVSSVNLYYNIDGKVWRYTLTTSRGITSMSVQ